MTGILTLTADLAQPAAPPRPKLCGNCHHFQPYRDAQTKRVHPSEKGRCKWQLPVIKWPMAFRRSAFGGGEQDPFIQSVGVWKDTPAETCACFVEKGKS